MKSILVLLSTYNGDKYLKEQLDSIFRQEGIEFCVLARDDGSKDSTINILKEYKDKFPQQLIIEQGENIGCKQSFMWLVKTAARDYPQFDYYAFADQDDIWFESKLSCGVKALEEIPDKMKIYYSGFQLVDDNLKNLPTPDIRTSDTLEESFIHHPYIGCSMILSRDLIDKLALSDLECPSMHDAWAYRVNLAFGGKIIHDQNVHMLYRQHSKNTVGYNRSVTHKWRRRLKSFTNCDRDLSRTAKKILYVYGSMLSNQQHTVLESLANYRHSAHLKWKILTSRRYSSSNRTNNILFKVAILTNRF